MSVFFFLLHAMGSGHIALTHVFCNLPFGTSGSSLGRTGDSSLLFAWHLIHNSFALTLPPIYPKETKNKTRTSPSAMLLVLENNALSHWQLNQGQIENTYSIQSVNTRLYMCACTHTHTHTHTHTQPDMLFIKTVFLLQVDRKVLHVLGQSQAFSLPILFALPIPSPLLPAHPLSPGSRWFLLTQQKPCRQRSGGPDKSFLTLAKPFCICCQAGWGKVILVYLYFIFLFFVPQANQCNVLPVWTTLCYVHHKKASLHSKSHD